MLAGAVKSGCRSPPAKESLFISYGGVGGASYLESFS